MKEEKRVQEDTQSDKYICLTKVWGVTYSNRQEIVQKCQQGQELELEITDSPHWIFGSYRAVAVYGVFDEYKGLKSRTQLGFLQREIAEKLMPNIQHGKKYECYVEKVTGGSDNKDYFGLNIKIIGEPIEEYKDIPAIPDGIKQGIKQLAVLLKDGKDIPIMPDEQLTVITDEGYYQTISPYEYLEYLDSILGSEYALISIINSNGRLIAMSEDEYDVYRNNQISVLDCMNPPIS